MSFATVRCNADAELDWERCIKRKYKVADLPDTFDTGGIVGIAEITDCVRRHRSKWFHGPFGWVLARARRLPFKPCKGQLKFFTPDI
jgi:hypothetical protein